jgi:hypothetical protein
MAKDRSSPLSAITFYCKPDKHTFTVEPRRIISAPELEHHPFEYFADCPKCGTECGQVHWQRNLLKAYVNATGPRTEDGKAATAANLEGHPTKDESLRTRFNAMSHGLSARTATYFPSKPDGYAFCKTCDVNRDHCRTQPACVKKTELFMVHHAAFEQRNPKHLMGIYADLQASIFAVLQQILQTIIADGVKITTPECSTDKDGNCIIARYFYQDADGNTQSRIISNIEAHPLFRPLGEILTRTGLSLSDMGMTAKIIEDEDAELGKLNDGAAQREELGDYQRRQVEALEGLRGVMEAARINKARDPVLLEHQAQQIGVDRG